MMGPDILLALYFAYLALDAAYSFGKRRGFKEAKSIWKPKFMKDLRNHYREDAKKFLGEAS